MTAEFIAARLAPAALADATAPRGGDHVLNPSMLPPNETPLTPASVLVPLVTREDGLTVLLTQRTQNLKHHPGQISFPGGRQEPDDEDSTAAALRETREEIGLDTGRVRLIGRLNDYVTGSGYLVTPIVGLVAPPFELAPDPFEVAEVFEVPLAFIVDPANHERRSGEFRGSVRHYYVLPYENRFIWGATAGMLIDLARRLAP